MREGSLEAPIRHVLDWQNPWFWDDKALEKEMERIFEICHGCRRQNWRPVDIDGSLSGV